MRNNLRADPIIDPVWVLTLVVILVFDWARGRKIFRLVNGERSASFPKIGRALTLERVIRNR
jgi:hypothetical protein